MRKWCIDCLFISRQRRHRTLVSVGPYNPSRNSSYKSCLLMYPQHGFKRKAAINYTQMHRSQSRTTQNEQGDVAPIMGQCVMC